jgi:hypothetical protein
MISRSLVTRTALLLASVALAACQDGISPTSPSIGSPDLARADEADDHSRPDEAKQRGVSRAVPGFGGYYFDEKGDINVYLLAPNDPGAVGKARAAVLPILNSRRYGGHQQRPEADVRVRQGQYTFAQLRAWRDQMTLPVLSIDGVTYTAIDEARNRLAVATDPARPGTRDPVLAKLDELSIPREAVVFKDVKPFSTSRGLTTVCYDYSCIQDGDSFGNAADSLVDKIRPIVGGIYMGRTTDLNGNGVFERGVDEGGQCTLGFNAVYDNVRVHVVNAHCTGLVGTDENSSFYNRYRSSADYIGEEHADPSFSLSSFATTQWGGSCDPTLWNGWRCRRSDMALVRSTGPSGDFSLGYIARPESWAAGPHSVGSLRLSQTSGPLRIVGEDETPELGQVFDKIGTVTGWTWGDVIDTCIDSQADFGDPRNPSNIVIRCSTYVGAGAAEGDSGAPVFYWQGTTVVLYGILWGGNGDGGFVFSSIGLIRNDLGASGGNAYRFRTYNP